MGRQTGPGCPGNTPCRRALQTRLPPGPATSAESRGQAHSSWLRHGAASGSWRQGTRGTLGTALLSYNTVTVPVPSCPSPCALRASASRLGLISAETQRDTLARGTAGTHSEAKARRGNSAQVSPAAGLAFPPLRGKRGSQQLSSSCAGTHGSRAGALDKGTQSGRGTETSRGGKARAGSATASVRLLACSQKPHPPGLSACQGPTSSHRPVWG